MNPTDALKRVHAAMDQIVWRENQPQWAGPFAKVRHTIEISNSGTASIDRKGRIKISVELASTLPLKQLGYVVAHECSHPMLDHFDRMPEGADRDLWNKAGDVVINEPIFTDGGADALPEWVIRRPEDYTGPLITEAIYSWFRRNPDKVPQGKQGADGKPMPGAGCGAEPSPTGEGQDDNQNAPGQAQSAQPGQNQTPSWGQVATQARAIEKIVGKGSEICSVIAPKPSYQNFADLLRFGARQADTGAGRSVRTYARASRRDGSDPKILMPGYMGGAPKFFIAIDCSSSMSRSWIERIAGETIKISKLFPRLKIYLVTHTDRVVWAGWITDRSVARDVIVATGFEGGTFVRPAYEALAKLGTWDAGLHFTDCEVERPWPDAPTRKLIVGAWGDGAWRPYSKPPAGAKVVPCRDCDLGRVAA
jgi:hypothetical protein